MEQVNVYVGRYNKLLISLPDDVSGDIFSSEIRAEIDQTSELIATWDISFVTDGSDGELELILDDAITRNIINTVGYMDIKRVVGGEPVNVFDEPLEVVFRKTVTA